jgi:hypothetical protein
MVLRLVGVCGALYAKANICTCFDTNKTCVLMSDYGGLTVVIVEEHNDDASRVIPLQLLQPFP